MDQNRAKDIAYNYVFVNPSKQLQVWFSYFYKQPLFHDRLEDNTEEELLINYYVVKFIENEQFLDEYKKEQEIADEEKKDDEEWFKKQMGREYVGDVKKDDEVHDVY